MKTFNNSFNNIKEMITYFRDKNHKLEKKYKNNKTLTSSIESVDTVDITGATTASATLSVTGARLMLVRISAGFLVLYH